jgi:hypothetical protein
VLFVQNRFDGVRIYLLCTVSEQRMEGVLGISVDADRLVVPWEGIAWGHQPSLRRMGPMMRVAAPFLARHARGAEWRALLEWATMEG